MQGAEYQALAMRTNDKKSTDRLLNKINDLKLGNHCGDTPEIELGGVLNAALGLSGEVGELNDMLKKWIFPQFNSNSTSGVGIHFPHWYTLNNIICPRTDKNKFSDVFNIRRFLFLNIIHFV